MFYILNEEVEIAGASPETLVKIQDRHVMNLPIAGTRRRGTTPEEDEALGKELLGDEKELAEHTMLVDLGRNDVGRVSAFGSVHVSRLMKIARFSHVMHIVSQVEGDLAADKDAIDALGAILPAGTLSGAPKIRACEIIDELEPSRRGFYGGGLGYIDFAGNVVKTYQLIQYAHRWGELQLGQKIYFLERMAMNVCFIKKNKENVLFDLLPRLSGRRYFYANYQSTRRRCLAYTKDKNIYRQRITK